MQMKSSVNSQKYTSLIKSAMEILYGGRLETVCEIKSSNFYLALMYEWNKIIDSLLLTNTTFKKIDCIRNNVDENEILTYVV